MGRQVQFHALPEDCQELLSFVSQRDTVTFVVQEYTEPELTVTSSPCAEKTTLVLWKDSLGTELRRTFVPRPVRPYFRVRTGVGLEFSHSLLTEWNGQAGLTQRRATSTPINRMSCWSGGTVASLDGFGLTGPGVLRIWQAMLDRMPCVGTPKVVFCSPRFCRRSRLSGQHSFHGNSAAGNKTANSGCTWQRVRCQRALMNAGR